MRFRFLDSATVCEGYEIHMGRTASPTPLTIDTDGLADGCFIDSHCFGTYIHGILDNPTVIEFLLSPFRSQPSNFQFDNTAYKQSQYDALADWLRKYLNLEKLYALLIPPPNAITDETQLKA